jgi:serine/threonine protein kinase
MWEVDPQARKIIKQCLAIDPSDRSSCQELLQDPYFQSIAETQQLANSEVPQSFVSTEAMTNIRQPVDAQEDSNSFGILVTTFPHLRNQMEGRQSGVLDLNLSDRLEAVLDAIHVCAQKNATVAKAFFELQPWKERYQDHAEEGSLLRHQLGLTVRLEAVLEAINTIAKSDPEVARDFLYILHQSPAPQAT